MKVKKFNPDEHVVYVANIGTDAVILKKNSAYVNALQQARDRYEALLAEAAFNEGIVVNWTFANVPERKFCFYNARKEEKKFFEGFFKERDFSDVSRRCLIVADCKESKDAEKALVSYVVNEACIEATSIKIEIEE